MSEEKGTSSVTPSLRRELAKWAFWGASLHSLGLRVQAYLACLSFEFTKAPGL
jgi:hypothetical protein